MSTITSVSAKWANRLAKGTVNEINAYFEINPLIDGKVADSYGLLDEGFQASQVASSFCQKISYVRKIVKVKGEDALTFAVDCGSLRKAYDQVNEPKAETTPKTAWERVQKLLPELSVDEQASLFLMLQASDAVDQAVGARMDLAAV